MGRRLKRALIGVPLGLILGGGTVFIVGIAAPEFIRISQFEGAYAMAVAFVYTPTGAIVGALCGLFWALRGGKG